MQYFPTVVYIYQLCILVLTYIISVLSDSHVYPGCFTQRTLDILYKNIIKSGTLFVYNNMPSQLLNTICFSLTSSSLLRFPPHSCNEIAFVDSVTKANAFLVLFVSFSVVYLFVKTKQHFMHNQPVSHLSLRNRIFKSACDIIRQLAVPPNNAVTAWMNKSLHCCIVKTLLHEMSPITCNAILNKDDILCVLSL